MTFRIKGHRVIVTRGHDEKEVVARQDEKTHDCYGNWGGFGLFGFIVAVQV